jgi:hypothetical protein
MAASQPVVNSDINTISTIALRQSEHQSDIKSFLGDENRRGLPAASLMYVNRCHNLLRKEGLPIHKITSVKSEAFCAQMGTFMYRCHS